jgi:hypothetical protein
MTPTHVKVPAHGSANKQQLSANKRLDSRRCTYSVSIDVVDTRLALGKFQDQNSTDVRDAVQRLVC